ncbi:hypothetical protein [Sphingobium sp. S6]|uniref:hypothetical protein n=1 Tax=Sphingobium sp. S6 TaxID=2758386 RepID=UPI00191AE42D|nr:hypothetical protein [Sphingobium sp. S6]
MIANHNGLAFVHPLARAPVKDRVRMIRAYIYRNGEHTVIADGDGGPFGSGENAAPCAGQALANDDRTIQPYPHVAFDDGVFANADQAAVCAHFEAAILEAHPIPDLDATIASGEVDLGILAKLGCSDDRIAAIIRVVPDVSHDSHGFPLSVTDLASAEGTNQQAKSLGSEQPE